MKKRVGMHSGYFRDTPLEQNVFKIVQSIYEAGGNAVEFMPAQLFSLSSAQRTEFRSLLEMLDMELIIGAGRSPSTDPSNPDPQIQKSSYKFAEQVLQLLYELGCHKWDGLIHACWPGHPDGTLTTKRKASILSLSAENMRHLMPLAEKYQIDFCFEVVNRFEHYLLNTASEALGFCDMINNPHAKILLDVFHMNIEENDISEAILMTGKAGKLGHFHVGEANRSVPGTVPSHIDWEKIFDSLKNSGYDGTVILEPFIIGGAPYSSNVCLWRDLTQNASFEKYLDYMKTGISFIKNLWL